ncbi:serine hydrolase domain-containing protein [Brevibacillus daliensis]|uniref:serine hydrolase domain-containing protein n=1 Tax=Brevibacillus daliensis TaxID=2892995 RepID=UPI001E471795|nr:serine hydrolase domain-containing protein [Brevibacillus daliensis]
MIQMEEVEQQIQFEMKQAKVPGLAIAIIHEKKLIYAKGFGVTALQESGTAVMSSTLFRIGSISKLLTATLVMQLVEEGLLNLDVPVCEYIPWFSLKNSAYNKSLTLRTLLSHRAGFTNGGSYAGNKNPDGLQQHVELELSQIDLDAPPGKTYSYSNFHFNIAGCVSEAVTGIPFANLIQEYLFKPLNMKLSTYDPLIAMTHSLALPHYQENDDIRVLHRFIDNPACYPSFFCMSSVTDLAKFALLHLNNGKTGDKRLLQPETVEEMHQIQTYLFSTCTNGFGLGFALQEDEMSTRFSRHYGDISSYTADFVLNRESGSAVIIVNNRPFPHNNITKRIFDQLHITLPKTKINKKDLVSNQVSKKLTEVCSGTFFGPSIGLVKLSGEPLQITINKKQIDLYELTEDHFLGFTDNGQQSCSVGVIREHDGSVLFIQVNNNRCYRFTPQEFHSESINYQEYCGTYSFQGSPDWKFEISQFESKLMIEADGDTDTLIQIGEDLYTSEQFGAIKFHRDKEGQVLHFLLHCSWKMNKE